MRCLIAGMVALLPVGGTILAFFYMESMLSDSGLSDQAFYFPGLGLILALLGLYVVGLFVTTFLGRWIWRRVDRLLEQLPVMGGMYQTLKQILGYGSGADAMFQEVALVPSVDTGGVQIGLITNRMQDGRCAVFLPGSPNPAAGRLVMLEEESLNIVEVQVADALKALVSVGKSELVSGA